MSPGTIPFTVSQGTESGRPCLYYACGAKGFNIPVSTNPSFDTVFYFQLPSGFRRPVEDRLSFMPVRKTQAGAR
jgi:hypothetical protein